MERNALFLIYLPTKHPDGMNKQIVPEERLVGSSNEVENNVPSERLVFIHFARLLRPRRVS